MISYKGKPIIGPDSSARNTSEFFALAGTALFWLLFLIFSFVIKPQPKKPVYKEVQIVLSSTPVVQKAEESPAPAEQAAAPSAASAEPVVAEVVETPAPEPTPVPVQKTVEAPKPKTEPKPQTKPLKAAKPKEVPVTYAVDTMEAFANQTKQQPKKEKQFDESLFKENESEEYNDQTPKKVQKESFLYGEAGQLDNQNHSVIRSDTNNNNNNNNSYLSGDTAGKLKRILETEENNYIDGTGKTDNFMSSEDGKAVNSTVRPLYDLDTELSDEAKRTMQISKTIPIKITFTVDTNGNVIANTIDISKEALLSTPIKTEMREKIQKWKFTTGKTVSKFEFLWNLSPY